MDTNLGRGAKYAPAIALSLIGGFLIFLPSLLSAPSHLALKNAENLTRTQLKERAKTAEVGRVANVSAPLHNREMVFRDYINQGDDPARLMGEALAYYLITDVVRVHDQTQRCIGIIKKKKFIWVKNNPEVCK